ncbi:MAG: hypothetical protein H6719_36795 [Sandaracinaceae bacterium]|nr:hypothetical protein [Sandaracinaceae bacterium]
MRPLLSILVLLAGCAAPTEDAAVSALEGTREGYGILRLLNDGEGTTAAFLDVDVALDRRAAQNLINHRDGWDGVFGTADDDLFDSIAEVDAVSYVGPSALERLREFAVLNDYVPGDNAHLGTYDGVDFTYGEADRVLDFVNVATDAELADASVPSRAITSIVDARPIATVAVLADLYWVGQRTLEHLIEATAEPVGGEVCMSHDDCAAGLRCTGRPGGEGWGKCRDLSNRPGFQEECDEDAQCMDRLICIGQTVYTHGYCADDWMRDSFTVGGAASIPPVVMTGPMGFPFTVYGQASVPEDIILDIDIVHSDPSSLWIGLQPPTGQEAVTLWDGATMTGPLPTRFVDRAIYRDDAVNGTYVLLVQNVGGRGEGRLGEFTLTVTSRWD